MTAMEQLKAWGRNMAGLELSEKEAECIPYPAAELYLHVTTKTAQAGSVLGGIVIGPLVGFLRGSPIQRSNPEAVMRARRYGGRGLLIGLAIGPAMTYFHQQKKGYGHEGFYDRSYRLRHNQNQLWVDRASYSAGLIGGIFGGLSGASAGVNMGVLAAAVYNNLIKPRLYPS